MRSKRKTHEEFVKEVYNLVGEEYTVEGIYRGMGKKIKMRHNVCSSVYEVRPINFIQGYRCRKCQRKILGIKSRKSPEQFRKEFYSVSNNEYELLSEYVKATEKVRVIHLTCGYEYSVIPNKFLAGQRCPKCYKKMRDHENFLQDVFKLVGDEYTFHDKYVNNSTKINVTHNVCGYKYSVTPANFLRGRRCPKCKKNIKNKSTEYFKLEVKEVLGDEYEILDEYKNTKTKVKTKHLTCGYIWLANPSSLRKGHGCPKCASSKAEKLINKTLKDLRVQYIYQYRINECRNIKPLPFDFAVFVDNKLKLLIEYDGEQHYSPMRFSQGEENLLKLKRNDKIKSQFCKKNNIPLLRISYLQFNEIEKILINSLIKYGIIHGNLKNEVAV